MGKPLGPFAGRARREAEPGLFGLLGTPTAHDSLWRGSSLTGVMTGPEIEDRLVLDATAALPRVA